MPPLLSHRSSLTGGPVFRVHYIDRRDLCTESQEIRRREPRREKLPASRREFPDDVRVRAALPERRLPGLVIEPFTDPLERAEAGEPGERLDDGRRRQSR